MRENISGKKKKILLVEDSRLTAMVLSELLGENGYETETVATGEEAVEEIMGGVPLDLVLMDIELAGEMSGIAAARRIIKSRDIPVVFLTANTSGGIIEKIKEVKAYGFVLKGTDKAALLSTVEMALKLHEANIHARMFERLFENSLNELYIFHPESLKFVAVNRAARKNLGYTTEEMNVMTPLDLNPEFNMESFRRLLAPLVSEEQEQVLFNTVHRRKDGSLYPVEINIQLFDYEGAKLCMALVVNLTERIAMEEELKEKDTTIRAIMDSARDAIIMLDGQGKVIFWNPAAEQFFGYSREEVLGKDLHRLVVPDERLYQIYTQAFQHFQLTGEGNAIGKTIEMKAKHKDGREFDVEISMSALRSRDAWHAVGIVRDISERKQAQEELENSRKQYIELAEEAPIGILKCDLEGNIVYVNQKTLEILGSPSIEETKKINLLTFPLLVRYGLSRKLEECLQNNKPGTYEMNYETKWGKKVWLRVHVKPLANRNTVTGAQLIIDDITEKKRLEEDLRCLSVTDCLTDSYNRRYFTQKLEEEIERARRNGNTFSLIMLDIDHFKSINDRFGHNAGDLVLKNIVELIKNRIRKIDILARWGGEEFVILLLDTTIKNAVRLAEELRESLSRMDIPGVGRVTASFGVSTYCSGDTADTLVNKADKMMYEAKAAGRNCVRYMNECE